MNLFIILVALVVIDMMLNIYTYFLSKEESALRRQEILEMEKKFEVLNRKISIGYHHLKNQIGTNLHESGHRDKDKAE